MKLSRKNKVLLLSCSIFIAVAALIVGYIVIKQPFTPKTFIENPESFAKNVQNNKSLLGNNVYFSGIDRLDITDKQGVVGICYSTWFNPVVGSGKKIYDNSEILKEPDPTKRKWGGVTAFHFWGQPALGYYRSDDKAVIREHMRLLSEANVDFIVIDNTNESIGWKKNSYYKDMVLDPCTALLSTMKEMRSEGLKTPALVFWSNSGELNATDYDAVVVDTWKTFYESGEYADLFVYWEGKPLLITTGAFPESMNDNFTFRKMGGLETKLKEKEWSFLQPTPQNITMNNGQPEQVSVSAAYQRSYMTNDDAVGRFGGKTFQVQWKRAFSVQPKIVLLTWWNEWIAQLSKDNNGAITFVDNYNPDFSRDIEPMKGGHGDQYYQWMIQYITAFKEGQPFPENLIS